MGSFHCWWYFNFKFKNDLNWIYMSEQYYYEDRLIEYGSLNK